MQFPESFVLTETQALFWLVRKIPDGRALRVVVTVRNIASRQWRFDNYAIFDDSPVAVPKRTLRGDLKIVLIKKRIRYIPGQVPAM